MFKGVSQCVPTVGIICFGLFNPFHYSLLPLHLPHPPHFSTAFNTNPYILYLYVVCDITSALSFFFSSFPKFHRVVPLLQTCSTSEFVYDHTCFCVYVYLWIYLPCMRKKHAAFVFLSLASSISFHFLTSIILRGLNYDLSL
jgi:hypothetical protein